MVISVIAAVSSLNQEEDANVEDTEVQKRGMFGLPEDSMDPESDSKVYNAFQNYRRLLKSQRWKKSKMDMYRKHGVNRLSLKWTLFQVLLTALGRDPAELR